MAENTTTVELTPWELSKLVSSAASNALTYIQHFGNGSLFPHEIEEMNRWKMLSDKLTGKEPTPVSGTEAPK